ncbi:MAG TPA: type II toxin-antitoxin system VapC family toxin [Bryobacteraceae bacterium]|nr:type II toxin-antitoxin system VapC family toxin [Bryobacteraceae bacterium]
MTYLDTHVVVWLYDGKVDQLSQAAAVRVQSDSLFISPAVILELEFLHEVHRLMRTSQTMVERLSAEIGLSVCGLPFADVVENAVHQKWVRDPFDRLIVAQASVNDAPLISKDEKIRRYYKRAVW